MNHSVSLPRIQEQEQFIRQFTTNHKVSNAYKSLQWNLEFWYQITKYDKATSAWKVSSVSILWLEKSVSASNGSQHRSSIVKYIGN